MICVDIHIITPEKKYKNESANSKSACHATVHISMYASSNSASHIDAVWKFSFGDLNVDREVLFIELSAIGRIFFHPSKFDKFKDEKISDYKTVSCTKQKLRDWLEFVCLEILRID